MAYIGTTPKDIRSFGKAKFDFTATQGQTAFTGVDDDGKTLGFTDGQISVYVNGILMDASDYTTSGSNTVTLVSPTNLNDVVSVVALQTDIPNSDYVPATGGTFTGPVTHTGSFTSQGIDDNATSTAMTLDTSGNVLVGTTDTDPSNDTSGTGGIALGAASYISLARDSATPLLVNRIGTDGELLLLKKNGVTEGAIGVAAGDNIYIGSTSAGHSGLGFGSNEITPMVPAGTNSDGGVNLGYPTRRFNSLYLSGGVYLGGVGSANKLDDYEEGTWTPTAHSGLASASAITAYYTKIGNTVTVWANLILAGNGSGSQVMIGGLPFNHNGARADVTPWLDYSNYGTNVIPRVSMYGGVNYVRFFATRTDNSGSNQISILGSNLNTSATVECNFTMTYRTA
jgi:hypothetical protein